MMTGSLGGDLERRTGGLSVGQEQITITPVFLGTVRAWRERWRAPGNQSDRMQAKVDAAARSGGAARYSTVWRSFSSKWEQESGGDGGQLWLFKSCKSRLPSGQVESSFSVSGSNIEAMEVWFQRNAFNAILQRMWRYYGLFLQKSVQSIMFQTFRH